MSTGPPATRLSHTSLEHRLQELTEDIAPLEHQLWLLAVLAAALDVALTAEGLQAGLTEGNPVVASLVGTAGIGALVALKLAVFAIAGTCRWRRPAWGPWLSLALVLPWLAAAAINATLLLAL